MYSNKKLFWLIGLLQALSLTTPACAQTPARARTFTTTTTTKKAPLIRPLSTTTTTTTVVKKAPVHLKKRRGKSAKTHSRTTTTTVLRKNSTLSGNVAKMHRHHHTTDGSAQANRSAKLDAFLKNPPRMKKTPYFNPPGLNVPSSPAL